MELTEVQLLADENIQNLIEQHVGDDARAFALSQHNKLPVPARLIAEQIACRQKAARKLPSFSSSTFMYESLALETASSEATARYKASFISGHHVIDMSGGLGIDTFFLSHSCRRIDYVEKNPVLCELMRINCRLLHREDIHVHEGDSLDALGQYADGSIDWVYVDPQRRSGAKRRIGLAGCEPDIRAHAERMLVKARCVCIKCSPMLEPETVRRQLSHIREYRVISVDGECRELLIILDSRCDADNEPYARSVVLSSDGAVRAEISNLGNPQTERRIADTIGTYWFEPDSAVIKARLGTLLANAGGLAFANNSVDYMTGDRIPENYPGKIWKVIGVEVWSRKRLMKYFRDRGIVSANISRRDFPLTPAQIRTRLCLREGGREHLFFTRNNTGGRIMVHGQRIKE